MHREGYFVCRRCGIEGTKSPLHKDSMCDPCRMSLLMESYKGELEKLPRGAGRKSFLYTLSVCIDDYKSPITNDEYVLVRVDESNKKVLQNLLEMVNLDIRQDAIEKYEYLLATDVLLDFERVECHLHNRFSGASSGFSRSFIVGLKTFVPDWSFRYSPSENRLSITTESIDEISLFQSDNSNSVSFDEADVQFILRRLEECKDGHLFRGVNRFYFQNDGMAASIYRNNRDLAEHGKLQEHEREIVENLLSKSFYQSGERGAVSALTDLRHSGKDTCLLDFSEGYKVALFFSCQRPGDSSSSIAELLILRESEFESKDDITYPNEEDFLIRPEGTEITGNRVEAQKSVFLYCCKGYVARDENGHKIESLLIAPRLKAVLFEYCGYTEETVYPDFQAFIENPENFRTKAKRLCQDDEEGKKNYLS